MRRRVLLLGLILVGGLCLFTPYNNFKLLASPVGGNQFPVLPLALLLVLLPLRFLTRAEKLALWSMATLASGIPGSGMMRTFIPNIPAPVYFSTATNDWERKVWGPMPAWLKMQDTDSARAFFGGYPRGQEHVLWSAWSVPLIGWGIFALCFFGLTFSVAALLRKQWIESERFAFPLVQLPLLLTEPKTTLLKSPVLWIGVAVPLFLHGLNGFHKLYPSLPELATTVNAMDFLTEPPFNQIGPLQLSLFPLAVGIGFLLAGEVGLSLWLFFVLFKLQCLFAGYQNWDQPVSLSGFSFRLFYSLQAFGGALALAGWVLWSARKHLKKTLAENIGLRLGFWGSLVGLVLWEWAAGIPPALIAASLLMILLALVTVSWATCQAGVLFMAMPFTTFDVLGPLLGMGSIAPPALYTLYRAEYGFVYNTRELLLPALLGGVRATGEAGLASRSFFRLAGLTLLVAVVVAGLALISLPYLSGGSASFETWTFRTGPQIPLQLAASAASSPLRPAVSNLGHVLGGFVVVAGLLFCRVRFGVGLHPIGFLTAPVYGLHMLWFSVLLGWLAKTILLRLGGLGMYRLSLPFFLGLILGDALSAVFWVVLGVLTGIGYQTLPG